MSASNGRMREIVSLLAIFVVTMALWGCDEPQQGTGMPPANAPVASQPAGDRPAPSSSEPGAILAQIGDIVISEADLEQEIGDIPVYMQSKFKTKSGRIDLLNKMVENELLARAAQDAGLDKDPAVRRKIEDSRKKILQNEYYSQFMKNSVGVPDAKILEYYEANKDKYKTKARARVRMITFDNEAAAKKTLEDVRSKPESFEALAKERSKDQSTAASGGLLGWVTNGGYIRGLGKDPIVNKAIFALAENKVSDVVKTKKGTFVILKVETLEPESYRPLDQVKRRIADELLVNDNEVKGYYDSHKDEFISKERVKARVVVFDTEKKAKQAKKQLSKKLTLKSFSDYAKKHSIDKTNAKNGGYLGYITKGRYIPGIGRDPGLETVLFSLAENQMTDPVKTKKGWSIFYAESKEDAKLKPLDRVRTLITNKLRRKMRESSQTEAMDNLKKKYNCQVFDDRVGGSQDDASSSSSEDIRNVFKPRRGR